MRLQVCFADNLADNRKYPEAILKYEQARKLDPKIDVSPKLARLYVAVGAVGPAREEYRKALKAHPRDADLWNDYGYYHYSQGDWKEAEKALVQATRLDSRHARAWVNLGLTLGQQQRYEDSLAAFEKAVSPGEAHCNLAFVLATQGKLPEAREAYRDALRLEPRLPLARAGLDRLDRPLLTPSIAAAKSSSDGNSSAATIETTARAGQ